ncbi:hypothetical protein NA655_03385 [Pseudomonas kuykendallii]|uniref:Uncharacterized protein n=1 Tax=Pseudomonas kuykendallii TaxID=1007099 RepID=A0A1H3E0Y4_9PSED|nr:hypothetical protein [Pseudomonas kuykendallii]MCQ4270061.1 hypothetical protein [Pseudomonas kuykendallii]SDX72355.1 hypothetical protein SAMN05216287_3650 [Pseudomonas kuykendallii]
MTTAIRTAGLPLLFALCVFASSGAVADSPGMRAAPVQQSSGGTSGVAPGNVTNQAPRAPMAPRAPNAPAYNSNNNARDVAPEPSVQERPSLEQQRRQIGSEMENRRKQ